MFEKAYWNTNYEFIKYHASSLEAYSISKIIFFEEEQKYSHQSFRDRPNKE